MLVRLMLGARHATTICRYPHGWQRPSGSLTTKPSAYRHGVTDAEIRTVISYPDLRVAENEPDLEVIADLADPAVAVVFPAMRLRPALVAALGLTDYIEPNYGPQRR